MLHFSLGAAFKDRSFSMFRWLIFACLLLPVHKTAMLSVLKAGMVPKSLTMVKTLLTPGQED